MEEWPGSIYQISKQTKALITEEIGNYRTSILEKDGGRRRSSHRPEKILQHSCQMGGSDIEGRRKAVKEILGISCKLPVPTHPGEGLFMVPTTSIRKKECVWLNYQHFKTCQQQGSQAYITFWDGSGLFVDASATQVDAQIKRASQVIVQMNYGRLFD
ncbi:competence protein ComK [Virgibacillus xinjiangensis]|uniref:Competence protein ComK n=1 Tax=Virgibacillus xinjiangensis TaxID=393090 RepID=A0ABV7CV82_9BACI